ncbi:hypothetical protein U14_04386 [Candidatus Moduliflexus flocculans]|uniref:Uncharacterized protein n=1 Tax=Candidatus Moduliflexus flocculans TaxID=1499966 RepID=A0A0S6W537_9BACT|nr:hypothetical protein U14_04386 [Candidatus Moduliflexus flocculans]
MMWKDPIVAEIHQNRAEQVARFHGDIDALLRDLQEQEQRTGIVYVSFDSKPEIRPKKRRATRRQTAKPNVPVSA